MLLKILFQATPFILASITLILSIATLSFLKRKKYISAQVTYSIKELKIRIFLIFIISGLYLYNQAGWINDNDGSRIEPIKEFLWSFSEILIFLSFMAAMISLLFRLQHPDISITCDNPISKNGNELIREIVSDEKKFTKTLIFISFLTLVLLSVFNKTEPLKEIIFIISNSLK